MSITADFDNIIQIANDKTLSISKINYGDVPSIKNVGTANDIKLEITIPSSEKDLEVEIGNVETGEVPSVEKRLENGTIYLDFVLPIKGEQGEPGPQGNTATIEVGRVSIGNIAKVENVGTKQNAILNFTLPYASGQGSYIPGQQSGGSTGDESFGGDSKTAEELKNVTAGINRSAKATEELETTIANILSQVTAMVEQNKVIISRVVNQSEQLTKTLGDRIDANKLSIKAIQMTAIDRSMLDETKSRMSNCEQTVSLLRGELRQIFTSETYREDKKEIEDKLDELQQSIDVINVTIKQLDDINDSIAQLDTDSIESKANIELLQKSVSELSAALANKQDAGQLVTIKDLDASLKNSIEAISPIRITANQNTKKIADITDEVNNLSTSVQSVSQTMAEVQVNYAAGDKTNKTLIDNLDAKVDGSVKTINETIADIQLWQSAAENKYADAANVYSKKEVDDSQKDFMLKTGGTVTGNLTVKGFVTAETFNGRLAGNADTATAAVKATNDGDGNNIVETYVTKAEYNGLAGKIESTEEKATQIVNQLADYTDQISNNAAEITGLNTKHADLADKVNTLSKDKADATDITTLHSLIDSNKEDGDTKLKELQSKLGTFMPKDAVIPEAQIDSKFTEKLTGISKNANDIAELKTSQASTSAKVDANSKEIADVKTSLAATDETIEQLKQMKLEPARISFEAIEQMFKSYMPITPASEPENTEGGNE